MTRSGVMAVSLILILGALAGACGNANRTTETFTGTVVKQSAAVRTIAVVAEGEADVTLVSTDPSVTVGIGIGQPAADGNCAFVSSNSAASAGSVLSISVVPGSYCVSVYDVGAISASVTFDVTVVHP